jgi:hypothetical protein
MVWTQPGEISGLREKAIARQVGNGQNQDLKDFYTLVNKYSLRKLTYDEDALNAFHGISTLFERMDSPLHNLLGVPRLPCDGSRTSGDCLSIFTRALLWSGNDSSSGNFLFPTWTWAGWRGEVAWQMDIREASKVKGFSTLLNSVSIGERCGKVSPLDTASCMMDPQNQTSLSFDPWVLIIDGFVVSHDLIHLGVWPDPHTLHNEHQLDFSVYPSRQWAKARGIDLQDFEAEA